MAKATRIVVDLLVQNDVDKKFRKKLAADVQNAITSAMDNDDLKYLNTTRVEAVKVAHTPYRSEF